MVNMTGLPSNSISHSGLACFVFCSVTWKVCLLCRTAVKTCDVDCAWSGSRKDRSGQKHPETPAAFKSQQGQPRRCWAVLRRAAPRCAAALEFLRPAEFGAACLNPRVFGIDVATPVMMAVVRTGSG